MILKWKQIVLAIALVSVIPPFALADKAQSADVNKVVSIIKKLPSLHNLHQCLLLAREHHTENARQPQVLEALETLAFVKRSIPELIAAIKPGSSVFDYPGLLAIGSVQNAVFGGDDAFSSPPDEKGGPVIRPLIPEDPFAASAQLDPKKQIAPTGAPAIRGYRIYYGTVGIEFCVNLDHEGKILDVKKLKRSY